MRRVGLARRSFYDVSPGLVPTADQKLIAGLEKWRGLVLAGNGLSGRSPADIPLVEQREVVRKDSDFRLFVKNSRKSDPVGPKRSSAEALLDRA